MIQGYIFAFITSVFFSLYVVPRKLSDSTPTVYTLFVGMGFAALSIISYFVSGILSGQFEGFHPVLLISCLMGMIWATGSVLFAKSIDKIGLSRSNQWKNFQGPLGVTLNLIFLREYGQTNYIYVLTAIIVIFISAMLFTIKKDDDGQAREQGVWLAVLAGFFFGACSPLQKFVTINGGGVAAQQVCFSAFVFISMVVFVCCKGKTLMPLKNAFKRDNIYGIIAGGLYFFASLFSINSYALIPASIAFTIIQFNAVWTVIIGVWCFREINFKKHWVRICSGVLLAIIGVVLLLFG